MSSLSEKLFERLVSPRPPKVQKEEIDVSTVDPGEESSTGTFHEVHRTDKESPSTLTGFSVIAKPKGNQFPAASVSSAPGGATRFSSRIRKKISSQKDTYTSVARHEPDENITIEPDDEEPLDSDDDKAMTDIEMAEISDTGSTVESIPEVESSANMVHLTDKHCRMTCKITDIHGEKHLCVCGALANLCGRHYKKRINPTGKHQQEAAWYQAAHPKRGDTVYGKAGFTLSDRDMELRKLDERDQMTAALQFVQNSGKAHRESLELIALKESRTEDPTKNLQVTFDQLEVRAGPPATDASGPPLPPPQPSTKNFYGFLDAADNRYKASSIDEATEYFKMGLAMDRKFDNERECDLWVASGAALQRWKKQSSPGAAPGSPAKSPLGATTPKRGNLAGPGSVLLETDDVVSLSESSATTLEDERKSGSKGRHGKDHKNKDSRRRRHKDKKTGKRGKDRKKGKGRGRRHGRRRRGSGDYDSDPSSSGSSSSSSKSPYDGWSSSSDKDSDDSRAYKRSERRKRIKKRSKQSRNSSRHSPEKIVIPRTHVFLGKDTSEGNPNKIHGLSIARKEILEALGPEGLRSRDFTELMAAAVDVPALPGTTNINSDTYETELLVDSLSSALLTNGKESGKGVHLDTNWKRPSRHALMRVKNGEGLLKLVGGLDKAKTSAFDNMSLYIEAFMVKRHYPDDKIDDYYNQGTLVRLMYKTYDYYNQLLGKLRELYYKHFQRWEGSPAAALLDHHSEKLLFIRCNSVNRTTHLLRSYTYLRDAAADGFSANEVIESLWERVSEIHQEI